MTPGTVLGDRRRKRDQFTAYVDLVKTGVGFAEAAQQVGVHRSTGLRWRRQQAGTPTPSTSRPPMSRPPRPVGRVAGHDLLDLPELAVHAAAARGRYLTLAEREIIADLHRMGSTIRAIAALLTRAPSTISRELRRNSYTRTAASGRIVPSAHRYGPHAADRAARARRRRPKPRKLDRDPVLRAHVRARLAVRWSPRQIAKTLPRVFPDHPDRHLAHETIYQALYLQGRGELRRELAAALRTGRARRRPRTSPRTDPEGRRTRFTEPMVMISERPAEAADRAVPGHWEGDLIIGRNNRSAIATLVERHTRYLLLAHLPAGRDALSVRDALIATVATLPRHLWRSLTWDQGSEMARHHQFRASTGIDVYFCDPASPWLRGSNENTNGLLRQYFPKGTDLSVHTPDHLAAVAAELNGRPRETLDWDTPAQRLATLLDTPH